MSATVHLDELNPETRARVLKQIVGGTHENTPILPVVTPLPATVEKETFIALGDRIAPSIREMDSESLGTFVRDGVIAVAQKLVELKPYVEELWRRIERGEVILGCSTKKEFCQQVLHRSPRAVRYMLEGGNHNRGETVSPPKPPKEMPDASPLDGAFEALSPFFGEGAGCPLNAIPTALGWVKQNQPLSAEQVTTLSAVVNLLDQISKFADRHHIELKDLLRSESSEVAA